MTRFLLAVLISLPATLAYSQYRDVGSLPTDTLATVGTRAVTARDLIERIELMPWQGKDKPSQMDSAKVKALQSLVAEQILSMEAAAQGIVDDSTFRMLSRNVEKLMVRDELYKREVQGKVSVSSDEISQGLKRFARQVKALMINAGSEAEAAALSKMLRSGARLDSLTRARKLVIDTASVKFGMLEKSQEDAVYSLSSGKPVSDPLNVPRLGWVVLHLLDSWPDPEYSKLSQADRQKVVKQKTTRRKEAARASVYVADELASRRADVKPTAFQLVAETLLDLFEEDTGLYRNEAGYRLDKVAGAAERRLDTHLDDVLVDLGKEGMTVQDVLEAWRNFDFLIPTLEKKEFLRQVNGAIREVVVREFLTHEGYRRKLEQTDAVRHDVEVWMNSWLANALSQKIVSGTTVTDQEVTDYLVSHPDEVGNSYLVNIREILTDSLPTALSLLERVIAGEDFKKLAEVHSKRKGWAAQGGESGYIAVSRLPEIGFLALESDSEKINGPIKTKDGYSLFTVLGKKRRPGEKGVPYDSLRSTVRHGLLTQKISQRLDEYVSSAVKNYPVTLYYDRLKQLPISPINMVTKRYIGFGGSMPASPGLAPVYGWVGRADNVKQVYP